MDDQDVQQCMRRWGVSEGQAREWYTAVRGNTYFAKALMIPMTIDGVSGLIVACSTPAASRAYAAGAAANQEHRIILDTDWFYFEVFWYPRLTLMNVCGLTDPQYGIRPLGNLGHLLEDMCISQGRVNFRARYMQMLDGHYWASLRVCLHELGVTHWAEITAGLSWKAYRGLDL